MRGGVSVIIPCYNAEQYLEECLSCVLRQRLDVPLEVLLIDDGSLDATGGICDRAAACDARVRVWHTGNQGVSAARNVGLSNAQGEWVTFVDADDLLPEGALERMLCAVDDQTDAVIAAHEELAPNGARTYMMPERKIDARDKARTRDILARRLIEGDSVYNIMCAKLHRRAHLVSQGVCLCEGVRIGEDALFNLEALLSARRVAYIAHSCYIYRMHGQSAMHQSEGCEFARMQPFFAALRQTLGRMGLYERYFSALANSMALRLYKECGLSGVWRRFSCDTRAVLKPEGLHGLTPFAVRHGLYGPLYVLCFPFAALRRKGAALVRRVGHG